MQKNFNLDVQGLSETVEESSNAHFFWHRLFMCLICGESGSIKVLSEK